MHLAVLTAQINVVATLAEFGADVNAVDVVRGALLLCVGVLAWVVCLRLLLVLCGCVCGCVWLCVALCVVVMCAIAEWSHAAALGCTGLCLEEH